MSPKRSSLELKIIHSGVRSAQDHMRRDEEMLQALTPYSPTYLHHYDWATDSLTYGYFSKPEKLLNLEQVQRDGIQMACRPTGGGLLFHLSDLAFSLLIPASHPWYSVNPLQNYATINRIVVEAVDQWLGGLKPAIQLANEQLGAGQGPFCMAHVTRYDLVLMGRKIGGAAQRRTRQGLLHQASLYLAIPPLERIQKLLLDGSSVVQAMLRHSYPLLSARESTLVGARRELREQIARSLISHLTQEVYC